jgi:hypothetical protein
MTDCRVAGRSAKCPMVWHSHAAFVGCSCPPCSAALPSLWGALRCAMLEIRRQLSAGCGRYSNQSFVTFSICCLYEEGKAKRPEYGFCLQEDRRLWWLPILVDSDNQFRSVIQKLEDVQNKSFKTCRKGNMLITRVIRTYCYYPYLGR